MAASSDTPDNIESSSDLSVDLLKTEGEEEYFYNPQMGAHVPIRDVQDSLHEASERVPPTEEEIQAMRRHRSNLAQSVNPTDDSKSVLFDFPPPGGVGAGVFFNDGVFSFREETAIFWYVIAPPTLGGNPQPLLYLTSSNHAAEGCEALVSYQYERKGVFRIWDWATPEQSDGSQFVRALSYDDWGDYDITYEMGGEVHHTLYIANWTKRISGTSWKNEVLLFNSRTRTYDRYYRSEQPFVWDPPDEKKYLGWGPIIETFEPYNYGTTNRVGYAEALLVQDGRQYTLTSRNSYIRNDNNGFEIEHLVPNHSLLAR